MPIRSIVAMLLITLAGCSGNYDPLNTVDSVDVDRYLGTWYEIASFPTSFQSGCTGTTAEYSLNDDGTIRVVNRCFQDSLEGQENVAEGTARVVEGTNNAKLRVSFFLFFEGDYWILELGEDDDYGYAVVGTPSREYLWILSRTPTMDDALYEGIRDRVEEKGFDPDRLEKTLQPEE